MEIKITESGHRLDKALADLTPLSRSQANDQIKQKGYWSMAYLRRPSILCRWVTALAIISQRKAAWTIRLRIYH